MTDNKKFKILFALLALVIAILYQYFKIVFNNLYIDDFSINNYFDLNTNTHNKSSIEIEIIRSWNRLIQLPNRNPDRNLKVAIGCLIFEFYIHF